MTTATSLDVDGRAESDWWAKGGPTVVTPEDEQEFQVAMEAYKRRSGRLFPTWSEVLEILGSLGYARNAWKPVDPWDDSTFDLSRGEEADEPVFGWFSTVEMDLTG